MTARAERDWLRRPSVADLALWSEVMRGVRPLSGRPAGAPADVGTAPAEPPPPVPSIPPRPRRAGATPRQQVVARGLTGLDKRQAERLRKGELEVEARLDLHGLTQAAAHRALDAFLAASLAAGRRCVLVITGKGTPRGAAPDDRVGFGEGAGVLRAMLPRWIDEGPHAGRVVALQPAHRKHGGEGAFYVYLRRAR